MPSVSVSICRTTIRLLHPMARRVPISRTRLATDDSVSSTAMMNAAPRTMIARMPPSWSASFLASLRLPVTWSASSLVVTTWAPGNCLRNDDATASTEPASFAFTSSTFTRSAWPDSCCNAASGKYTPASWPRRVGETRPTTWNVVPSTGRSELILRLLALA